MPPGIRIDIDEEPVARSNMERSIGEKRQASTFYDRAMTETVGGAARLDSIHVRASCDIVLLPHAKGDAMSALETAMTRRALLTGLIGTAAAATLGGRRVTGEAAGRAKVIRVESPAVWRGEVRDPKVVSAMVNRAMAEFTGKTSEAAWKTVFKPGMRVGLKINLLGRPRVYTAREVTEAVAAGAIAAGVKPADVLVWDRHAAHFAPTVYQPGTGRLGERIKTGGQYDRGKSLQSSGGPCGLDTLVAETDVTINLPLLKNHGMAGVTLALKNIAFGCYDHHRGAHRGNCDPFVTEAYAHYLTQTKIPFHILDATEACFDEGPQPQSPAVIWRENAIYIASDPVALDVVCREVINEKRRAAGLGDVLRQARHIETSAAQGLGQGDRALIDLVTVKV
jgi:uncharacterized protein (DUF362 family)